MKRILAFVLVVVAAGCETAGQAPARSADDMAVLTQLTTDMANAVVHRDSSKVESVLDNDFTFIHSNGTVLNRKDELAGIASTDSQWASVSVDNVKVRFYGTVGIVTGSQTFNGEAKDFAAGPRFFTQIFVKRDGRWQCVGGQFTLAPTKSPT
jgi:hypothetical protein